MMRNLCAGAVLLACSCYVQVCATCGEHPLDSYSHASAMTTICFMCSCSTSHRYLLSCRGYRKSLSQRLTPRSGLSCFDVLLSEYDRLSSVLGAGVACVSVLSVLVVFWQTPILDHALHIAVFTSCSGWVPNYCCLWRKRMGSFLVSDARDGSEQTTTIHYLHCGL